MSFSPDIKNKAIKKAKQSICRYKVSALGLNRKGDLIYSSSNKPRFSKDNGGSHAEMEVMLKAGPGLKYIIICRVNSKGKLLPIEPCPMCQEKANELKVKIMSIQKDENDD